MPEKYAIAIPHSLLKAMQVQSEKKQSSQTTLNQLILELETEVEQYYQSRNQLDREACLSRSVWDAERNRESILLQECAEALKNKLILLKRIANFSEKFQQLQQEFQDNQELLDALYVSIFSIAE
jgi:hypothetical protein